MKARILVRTLSGQVYKTDWAPDDDEFHDLVEFIYDRIHDMKVLQLEHKNDSYIIPGDTLRQSVVIVEKSNLPLTD